MIPNPSKDPQPAHSALQHLSQVSGQSWQHIFHARKRTRELLNRLQIDLGGLSNEDASIVVFGSLARQEATDGSDVDWTLLVDGKADVQHRPMAHRVRRVLREKGWKQPGPEGIFGDLSFSHQILNFIGGEDDSNANTTRRMLLLLESLPVGNNSAWEAVRRNLLERYLTEDHGLRSARNQRSVPLFLLNDIARYWRTMVVDFAYKQRDRENEGYALRNIKLGLSRKLIYASGLLACFSCDLKFPEKALFRSQQAHQAIDELNLTFKKTPLELIAELTAPYKALLEPTIRLLTAYDQFLGLLSDSSHRELLRSLPPSQIDCDPTFEAARTIRNNFGSAILDIFLRIESPIQKLMIERGVF